MFGDPILVIGEVYYESTEYTCSNALCINYGVIIQQELTWKKKILQCINGLKKNILNIAHLIRVELLVLCLVFIAPLKLY